MVPLVEFSLPLVAVVAIPIAVLLGAYVAIRVDRRMARYPSRSLYAFTLGLQRRRRGDRPAAEEAAVVAALVARYERWLGPPITDAPIDRAQRTIDRLQETGYVRTRWWLWRERRR